jgi:exopolysaccharide production protein ExoZ
MGESGGSVVAKGRWDFTESLRGFAVAGVVAVHCGHAARPGFAPLAAMAEYGANGVQLFFILSALLLTANTLGKPFVAGQFYQRRFLRIAPMFYLGAVVYPLWHGVGPSFIAPNGLGPLEFGLTFAFLHGWWPTSFNSVVPGGWSIACEMMFYAMLPFLLRWFNGRGKILVGLAIAAGLGVGLSLTASRFAGLFPQFEPELVRQWVHFNIAAELLPFLLGMTLFYYIPLFESRVPEVVKTAAPFAAVLLIALCAASGKGALSNYLTASVCFAALVLAAALKAPIWLDNPAFRYIGRISFSIYIVHFGVLDLLEPHFTPLAIDANLKFVILYASVFAVACGLSAITHALIEKPFMRIGRKRPPPLAI